jgi:cytochrome P450
MAYGYRFDEKGSDMLFDIIKSTTANFSLVAVPMGWAVDIMPSLRHLPDWFPGTGFKRIARGYRETVEASAYVPYKFVQRQMPAGEHQPSYVSKLVEQLQRENGKLSAEDEEAIVWSAAGLFGAATDTTVITLSAFALAMLKFPEVQRKAQQHVDRVV